MQISLTSLSSSIFLVLVSASEDGRVEKFHVGENATLSYSGDTSEGCKFISQVALIVLIRFFLFLFSFL